MREACSFDHWSVVRLDPTHIRVTLIDPGYVDPADREADVVLQHVDGVRCIDILSGEELAISDGAIHARAPGLGSSRGQVLRACCPSPR